MTCAIYRYLFLLVFLLGTLLATHAQEVNSDRAQRIYEWFVAGQGDSIYVAMNKESQKQLTPALFDNAFRQAEGTFGKLKSRGEWKTEAAQGVLMYYADMEFERSSLRFVVAFDSDGGMNTIRIVPRPAPPAPPVRVTADTPENIIEREITVGAEGFRLPGILTLPKAAVGGATAKVPCVILVHGSGPNDRDETIGPNKPFRELAWGLAAQGIAVIRYDKRTKVYGAKFVPEGRQPDYDTETVDDALAVITGAKVMPEVDGNRIFIAGHSLGGLLAPRIAQRSEELAGIILLAALARPLEDTLEEQFTYVLSLSGDSAAAALKLADMRVQLANVKNIGTPKFDEKIPLPLGQPHAYWAFAVNYKPVTVAAKLKLPILVLQGGRDYQVTMEDFARWKRGLSKNKHARFKAYPNLNHLFQEGVGKAVPLEYAKAAPVAACVIDDIAAFIK